MPHTVCTAAQMSISGEVGAPPSHPLSSGAVGFRGHGDMLPKQGSKRTLIRAADLETDHAEGHVGVGQELLRAFHPAPEDVLVGRPPGGLPNTTTNLCYGIILFYTPHRRRAE